MLIIIPQGYTAGVSQGVWAPEKDWLSQHLLKLSTFVSKAAWMPLETTELWLDFFLYWGWQHPLSGRSLILLLATVKLFQLLLRDYFLIHSAMHVCQCKFLTWSLFCGGYIVKYLWINQPGSPTKTLAMTFMIFSLLPHVMVLSWAGYRLTGHIKRTLTRHSHRFNLLNCRTNGYQEVKLTATTFTRLYIPLKLSGYTLMDKNILLVLYVTCAFYFHA